MTGSLSIRRNNACYFAASALIALTVGCSGDDGGSGAFDAVGGGTQTGVSFGGATGFGVGGAGVAVGGVPTTVPATGGAPSALGGASSGALGGTNGNDPSGFEGGTSAVDPSGSEGGATLVGGTAAKGGATSVGGTAARGGATSVGGTAAKGGATSAGGTAAKGGATSVGGTAAKGGATSVGGTVATGGTTAPEPTNYHGLTNWSSSTIHGTTYFLGNAQKDDKGIACTSCHGTNLEGSATAPACTSCHTGGTASPWRSNCNFCHGKAGATAANPPDGVAGETATSTLGVGRHAAHLAAGASHGAFACSTCHAVPAASDITHTLQYKMSADLSTTGHHGDVTFSGSGSGTTWTVTATTGTPVSARGTCTGACHSNGRGGAPVKTPYWAGGSWTTGCGNCHATPPTSGHHSHALKEGAVCADCHAGATQTAYSGTNHMNGTRNFNSTVSGQGMKLTKSGTTVSCNGSCHGNSDGHNSTW